ncbi:hypothetical protein P170DRAFT_437334 [Aspergillus steynii IBT 23096]|uniref:Uncharacterized protein n=1 Tax=Aspergillus steynii IBT 23096 TaxID=1392250 RepID=A0A2I2G3P3_9EURO|nr:uncharacterized protein P170DRAFT_437334 [Aspergillus steynii IBT 23096]PLB47496.1 hypothetical protein P170DRAFT_437334 [Aspergillus steynii IBT 23096]
MHAVMNRETSTPTSIENLSGTIPTTSVIGMDSEVQDRLASLEAQVIRLNATVACHEQQVRAARLATLNQWCSILNNKTSNSGYTMPPQDRGDILNDVAIIRAMSTFMPDKASSWKKVFEKTYGITFETASSDDLLLMASLRVITVFNIAAEVQVGQKWRTSDSSIATGRVRSLCMTIIDEWLVHPESLLEPGSKNEKAYNELLERYNFPSNL